MNFKDIEIGKHYSYAIWNDCEPVYYKCIGKDEGWFELQELDEEHPWLLLDHDEECPYLKEIHELQYIIRQAGQLLEEAIVDEVKKAVDNPSA